MRVLGLPNPVVQTLTLQQSLTYTMPDAATDATLGVSLTDGAGNSGQLLAIRHYAAGVGGSGQCYGVDIKNYPGANSPFVIHQYSNNGPMAILDNTDTNIILKLRNTDNQVLNPGNYGTGDFIDFHGFVGAPVAGASALLGTLDKSLIFHSKQSTLPWTFTADSGSSAPALKVSTSAGATGYGIQISSTQATYGLYLLQSGAQTGLYVDTNSGAAGFWPLYVNGQNYGPKFFTASSGGTTLTVQRDNTGSGTAQLIVNKGTGLSLDIQDASASRCTVDKNGNLKTSIGATTSLMTNIGVADIQTSSAGVGNAADTTDDTLFTYSLPLNSMNANAKSLRGMASGHFASNGNNKRVKFWFAGTAIADSAVVTSNNVDWTCTIEVTRIDATHVSCVGRFTASGVADVVTVTANLAVSDLTANASIVKITGASPTTGAASDVLGYHMKTWFEN